LESNQRKAFTKRSKYAINNSLSIINVAKIILSIANNRVTTIARMALPTDFVDPGSVRSASENLLTNKEAF
jgi:hypothetical protein